MQSFRRQIMRLDYLKIGEFKNLRDFFIDFDEDRSYTVLVGSNGSGKSNLIEAIVNIFRNLDLREMCPFDYELGYKIRHSGVERSTHSVKVLGQQGEAPRFWFDGVERPRAELARMAQDAECPYLPRFVFGYYSGPSDRLGSYFRRHRDQFYMKLKAPDADQNALPFRPLFNARTSHGQFVLLAFYSHNDVAATGFLREHLGVQGLDFVRFVINRPEWASRRTDDRFWGTTGVPRRILEALERLSIATTQERRKLELDFRRTRTVECWNFLLDRDGFQELADGFDTPQDLFKALESTDISDLLLELRVDVRVENVDGSISFRELSEGEQQLLLVLGLLRFTSEDEALYLLDEPDTHLNPAWSVQYLGFIEMMVGSHESGHIVMATHDPLVFAGLTKREIRIMRRSHEEGKVISEPPESDPKGMGVQAILTSDLFKLRGAFDPETLADLDERRRLTVKFREGEPTETESNRLRELNRELEQLDFSINTADPTYPLFVEAMEKWREENEIVAPVLTQDQRDAQKAAALEIVRRLKEAQGFEP